MNNICIYKKTSDGRFDKKEHIIPAFIGGMQTLEQGMVSDEVNEMFSKLEYRVSLDSLITMNRMFYGPGKRGKQNSKKSSHHKIGIMRGDSGKASLGYTEFGTPRLICQIHFDLSVDAGKSFEVGMSFDNINKNTWEKAREDFMNQLQKYDNNPIVIKEECIEWNQALLGYHNGKWFLGLHPNSDEDGAKRMAKQVAALVTKERERYEQVAQLTASSEQVTVHYQHAMFLDDYYRVIAKIAFNAVAYMYGREVVMAECFDGIRQAILSGEQIEEYVFFTNSEDSMRVFEQLNYQSIMGREAHWIVYLKMREHYIALVYLYGIKCPMLVVLAKQQVPMECQSMDGFVCDWQNKKEYRLIEVICKLLDL